MITKSKNQKGISLIVLVITIIVLAILATAVIIAISNSNIMQKASEAVYRSDMQNLQDIYSMWLADYISENNNYDMDSINYAAGDSTFLNDIMKGQVPDKYKERLKVVKGKLVYETEDEEVIDGPIDYSQYLIPAIFELDPNADYGSDSDYWNSLFDMGCTSYITMQYDEESGELCNQLKLDGEGEFECLSYVQVGSGYEWLVDIGESYSEYLNEKYLVSGLPISDDEMEEAIYKMFSCKNFEEFQEVYEFEDEEDFIAMVESMADKSDLDYSQALFEFINNNAMILEYIPNKIFKADVSSETIRDFIVYGWNFDSFDDVIEEFDMESELEIMNSSEIAEKYMLKYILSMLVEREEYGMPSNIKCTISNGVETITKNCTILGAGITNLFYFVLSIEKLEGENNITLEDSNGDKYTSISFDLDNCSYLQLDDSTSVKSLFLKHVGASCKYRLVPEYGCDIDDSSVRVMMNGVNITSSVYNSSTDEINIPNITGYIQVIADATAKPTFTTAQIKDINGVARTLTPSNVQDYYGTKVSNYTAGGLTYRLFFVDFYGEFGDAGTIYLKADAKSGLAVSNLYSEKSVSTLKIDEMNPLWSSIRGTATSVNWCDSEKAAAYLCNTAIWTTYADSNANFAIGSPSLEMLKASYNEVPHTNGSNKLEYNILSKYGNRGVYEIWPVDTSDYNTIDNVGYNKMYSGAKDDIWISTPYVSVKDSTYLVYICDWSSYSELGYADYDEFSIRVCPIISLKSTFVPELQAE